MTINELIEMLEDCRDEVGGDAEVRLMTQQSYPLEARLRGVTTSQEMNGDDEDDNDGDSDAAIEPVVYLVEGSQVGYGTKAAWDCCRTA